MVKDHQTWKWHNNDNNLQMNPQTEYEYCKIWHGYRYIGNCQQIDLEINI